MVFSGGDGEWHAILRAERGPVFDLARQTGSPGLPPAVAAGHFASVRRAIAGHSLR